MIGTRPPCEPIGFTAKHGTRTGYNQGCRCVECVAVQAEYQRTYRRRRLEAGDFKHGWGGYYTVGCRCDTCRAAMSAYVREYYQRRKAEMA